MIICRDELREELIEERRANPFPTMEPFDDRPIVAEGWYYGTTYGFQPLEEVASELDRMFGRDDFSKILQRIIEAVVLDDATIIDPDEFRILGVAGDGNGFIKLMFFVHPSKIPILPGYVGLMCFESMKDVN